MDQDESGVSDVPLTHSGRQSTGLGNSAREVSLTLPLRRAYHTFSRRAGRGGIGDTPKPVDGVYGPAYGGAGDHSRRRRLRRSNRAGAVGLPEPALCRAPGPSVVLALGAVSRYPVAFHRTKGEALEEAEGGRIGGGAPGGGALFLLRLRGARARSARGHHGGPLRGRPRPARWPHCPRWPWPPRALPTRRLPRALATPRR